MNEIFSKKLVYADDKNTQNHQACKEFNKELFFSSPESKAQVRYWYAKSLSHQPKHTMWHKLHDKQSSSENGWSEPSVYKVWKEGQNIFEMQSLQIKKIRGHL